MPEALPRAQGAAGKRCPASSAWLVLQGKSMAHPARDDNSPSNDDVARVLREMAGFLEMDGLAFKPQAYEKAAHAVATLDRPIAEVYRVGGADALDALPAIGKGIAERIAAMLSTGKIAELERRRKRTPVDILDLTAIEDVHTEGTLCVEGARVHA
jgi:hypothetical protein